MTLFLFIVALLLFFQVNEKLGHSEAMDNTSVDVMTHKKKRKKHKKEKELEEEPTILASAQCSPADSGQVSECRTNVIVFIHGNMPKNEETSGENNKNKNNLL